MRPRRLSVDLWVHELEKLQLRIGLTALNLYRLLSRPINDDC